jgi:type I restriction-modification system DNA methylase subunit
MNNNNCNNVSDVDFTELSINITNSLTKKEKKTDGIFFTPKSIIKQDIDYILNIKPDIKTILEPSCGSGEFINYLDTKLTNCEIDGVELNSKIYDKIKDTFNKDKITINNKDFLKLSFSKRYDLICGNPPYFVFNKKNIENRFLKYISGRPNVYIVFILKSIELLNENGILSFVLPCNFLNCSYYNLVREKISTDFNILKIDNHNSDKYLETEQNTCSMIIQKKPLYELKIHDMTIFNSKENIDKIDKLLINSTTLDEMGFEAHIGKCVWNQEKDILTTDTTKTLLIYSGDIKDNRLNTVIYKNPEKKNHIERSGFL